MQIPVDYVMLHITKNYIFEPTNYGSTIFLSNTFVFKLLNVAIFVSFLLFKESQIYVIDDDSDDVDGELPKPVKSLQNHRPYNTWSEHDVFQLIYAVQPHKILWDGTASQQKRHLKASLWKGIFRLFKKKYASYVVRSKWSNMCSQYRRIIRTHQSASSNWKYFEAMSFIPKHDLNRNPNTSTEFPYTFQVSAGILKIETLF